MVCFNHFGTKVAKAQQLSVPQATVANMLLKVFTTLYWEIADICVFNLSGISGPSYNLTNPHPNSTLTCSHIDIDQVQTIPDFPTNLAPTP